MEQANFGIHEKHAVMDRAYHMLTTGKYTWTADGYARNNKGQDLLNPADPDAVQGSLHALLCNAAAQEGINHKIVLELNTIFMSAGYGLIRDIDHRINTTAELIDILEKVIPQD